MHGVFSYFTKENAVFLHYKVVFKPLFFIKNETFLKFHSVYSLFMSCETKKNQRSHSKFSYIFSTFLKSSWFYLEDICFDLGDFPWKSVQFEVKIVFLFMG